MRALFLGTPEFAVPSLLSLAREHSVVGVFTQPDRPKGRGNALAASPVKLSAQQLGLNVYQPPRIRKPEAIELLRSLEAEIMIVVGYGQIIPQSVIDLPHFGILNVHASLLPKYRGAAPIQWAIALGELRTGITIMQIDAGLDTGDMLRREETTIQPDETAPQLSTRLALSGAELLLQTIAELENGFTHAEKQNEAEASLAPILKKEDGLIDWRRPAREIFNRWRGFQPWPGAFTFHRGSQLSISACRAADRADLEPGQCIVVNKRLFVGCGGHTSLELSSVQPAGKKQMTAEAFLNGYQLSSNEIFGVYQ